MRKEIEYKDKVYGFGVSKPGLYKRNKTCPAYPVWVSMIQRCYEVNYSDKKKGYETVTVCEEWLEYQVFASWYMQQKGANLGWQIDKDLLANEQGIYCKTYSPEYCLLLPERLNKVIQSEFGEMSGIENRGNSFRARIKDVNSKSKSLGTYKTKEEAVTKYKEARLDKIRTLALSMFDVLPNNTFIALFNYKV